MSFIQNLEDKRNRYKSWITFTLFSAVKVLIIFIGKTKAGSAVFPLVMSYSMKFLNL
jgi:hypothetical protein